MARRLTGRTAEAAAVHIGHYISGGGHALLLGWALFGGVFRSAPEPLEVTGVDVISLQEFETLLAAQSQPAPTPEIEVARPVAPQIDETVPAFTLKQDSQPDSRSAPAQDQTPPDQVPELPQPAQPPRLQSQAVPALEDLVQDAAPETPIENIRPIARPVTRVAPEAAPAPAPDLQISDVDQAPTAPAEDADPQQETQEETARQEAVTEIPTEPVERAAAPSTSIRPQLRPRRPSVAARETATTADNSTASTDSVAAALAEAFAETPAAPSGPPLTQGEKEALRIAVQQCWVVDVGSQAANVVVKVGMSLERSGVVQAGSLRLISARGGTESAQRSAFEAARRAILRCQKAGYELPIEKYDHWRDVEMTFNPENMRRR